MATSKNIVILGSTGSIGCQTLDVVKKNYDRLKVVGLVANSSSQKLAEQAKKFNVKNTILVADEINESAATQKVVSLIQEPKTDIVVNAMCGAAGLEASVRTLEAGKILALANKESLVVGGDLIMPLAKKQAEEHNGDIRLIPIDSEHGAIFQCLQGEDQAEITKLHITASGGPFFGKSSKDLKSVTKDEALAHPTWNMGPKITIDSATMMNKGLEVIEAHHLFDVDYDKINVLVQQQSAIHSMVEFADGSVKAHLGTTDMRIPIQYALSFPERWECPVKPMDFTELAKITFAKPVCKNFKCLQLAFQAGKTGGTMPCVMNAANEVAVAKFLSGKCSFLEIPDIVDKAMQLSQKGEKLGLQKVESLEQLKQIDHSIRNLC